MKSVQDWLEAELNQAIASLNDIPITERKGFLTGSYRQRARDVTTALRLVKEFTLLQSGMES